VGHSLMGGELDNRTCARENNENEMGHHEILGQIQACGCGTHFRILVQGNGIQNQTVSIFSN
jgi:hypothetical protein